MQPYCDPNIEVKLKLHYIDTEPFEFSFGSINLKNAIKQFSEGLEFSDWLKKSWTVLNTKKSWRKVDTWVISR